MAPSPSQTAPLLSHTPASVRDSVHRLLEQSRSLHDRLVTIADNEISWETGIAPLAYNENRASLETNILKFYQYASPSAELRAASREAAQQLEEFEIEKYMRDDLFKLVDTVKRDPSSQNLDIQARHYLNSEHRKYVANGLSLRPGPERDRFKEIKKRMSVLSVEFQSNLDEDTREIWVSVQDLDGVPADVINRLERDPEQDGVVKVTLQYADYFPVMDNARNSETRKRLFLAFENKCKGNVPLFREMMILRDEAARLLGYANYAAYQLEDRLVTSPEKVNSFLDDLRRSLADRGAEEIKRLKALKIADQGEEPAGSEQYSLWDHRYYNRLLLERDYQIDQQEIAKFFPLNKTLEGMLEIFSKLFGLVFYEIDASIQTKDSNWHPDVRLFHVWDEDNDGGEFVGYLYLDLYARDGKRGHPCNINLQPGFEYENGDRSYPSTVLLCSFAKPTGTKPCLLHHSDMVTLFHELGHGIHDLVSKTRYSRFHGTMTVLDFCETPSKMLENWCWLPGPLQSLSHHYETGEPIPQSMVDNLMRVKRVNSGLFYLRQLHVSIFDLHIHQPPSHTSILDTNITSTYNSLWQSITQMAGPRDTRGDDWGHGYATFFHLLSDYGAGYYSYLLAEVYALDMFYSTFRSDPLNPEKGRRYRRMVLEKGGSQPEMKTLSDFLGREATTQAFYEELAIRGPE
ncbi:hypothetical protein UA08_07388 [Talaromyces atroroseus]|uniref:Peptidase M3A/M3B catalytic domain-containing protein n=1 Tax=Talaromyces atroroseus TaxID=1441469 RepID=A0A225A950_TALAT|nr:hypothetical protein UA08_07388 [Talaromyces atroroseus]OKL57232.1 hypothetical protein UA08_07388 [Talaromyces atroroseus]